MTASKAEQDKLFVPIDHDFPALNQAYSNLTEDEWLQCALLRRKGSMPGCVSTPLTGDEVPTGT